MLLVDLLKLELAAMSVLRARFQIERDDGLWYSGEYSSFSVGTETDNYRLSVSGFGGDAGDALASPANSMRRSNGMAFSAPDRDNDQNHDQCDDGITGWWFKNCARSCLNHHSTNANWNADTDDQTHDVQFARMLVMLD